MAPKRKRTDILVEDVTKTGYISDDSDFYGDEATIQDLETRSKNFNAEQWSQDRPLSLEEIAQANIKEAKNQDKFELYNLYEHKPYARQLSETVADFLARLPPKTTRPPDPHFPWITIANPFRKAPKKSLNKSFGDELNTEGPQDEDSNTAEFQRKGSRLLEKLMATKSDIERRMRGQAQGSVTRAVNKEMNKIVQEILDTAVNEKCTSGKWMLFCSPIDVNEVWGVVARAVANNELGTAAKVAPFDGDNRKDRLICVYTRDFSDQEDVSRVANQMKSLKLIEAGGKPIWYKCDAYTYLGLNRDNEYGIKASMYGSKDFLKTKTQLAKEVKQKTLNNLLYAKREGAEWE